MSRIDRGPDRMDMAPALEAVLVVCSINELQSTLHRKDRATCPSVWLLLDMVIFRPMATDSWQVIPSQPREFAQGTKTMEARVL